MRFTEKYQECDLEEHSDLVVQEREGVLDIVDKVKNLAGSPIFLKSVSFLGSGRLGRHLDEVKDNAYALGISNSDMIVSNLIYDLSHAGSFGLGCSAAVVNSANGPMHVRCLDWDIRGLGRMTRALKAEDYVSIGVPGFSGVLSAMSEYGFSVSINWAPPHPDSPLLASVISPPFLLRQVMEDATSFKQAVKMICDSPLSCSAFFVVCGTEHGEGAVIETTPYESLVSWLDDKPFIVQTNHYTSDCFKNLNVGEEFDLYDVKHSKERASTFKSDLKKVGKNPSYDNLRKCLMGGDVQNETTYQQMVFHPKANAFKLWRRV